MSLDGAKRTTTTIVADAKRLSQALATRGLLTRDQPTSSNVIGSTNAGVNDSTSMPNQSSKPTTDGQRRVWSQPQTSSSSQSPSLSNLWTPAASSSLVEYSRNEINGDLKLRLRAGDASAYSKQLRVFAVSAVHTRKLYEMWRDMRSRINHVNKRDSRGQEKGSSDDGKGDEERPAMFYEDLFCLLARYAALEGKGWQAAIPHTVLPILQTLFGVSVECFSSPLNR